MNHCFVIIRDRWLPGMNLMITGYHTSMNTYFFEHLNHHISMSFMTAGDAQPFVTVGLQEPLVPPSGALRCACTQRGDVHLGGEGPGASMAMGDAGRQWRM